ncbi:hypothetical protein [Rossellomorea aquimaris]|uniref:hypothetical protein n=1 Tax=Rossellomorea aquimaris TaxID=189382 RepID=UPI000ABB310A|nr:hypothetical protein [Rossellomorea aquimaris]
MAFITIFIAIILFLLGYLTPVSTIYTLPVSLLLFLFGITRLLKKEYGQVRRC